MDWDPIQERSKNTPGRLILQKPGQAPALCVTRFVSRLYPFSLHMTDTVRLINSQAKFRRRTSHEPNRMQMKKNSLFSLIKLH